MKELAEEAGRDPVELRPPPKKEGRNRTVLERADRGSPEPGRVRGIAIHEAFGTALGHVVVLEADGRAPHVPEITSVAELGMAVHPDTGCGCRSNRARSPALAAALRGEVTGEDGRAAEGNFGDIELLDPARTSVLDVEVPTPGGGIGEPGTPPLAPAPVHAAARATGGRVRALPPARHGFTPV